MLYVPTRKRCTLPTRTERIRALAETAAYNPHEAAVAQAMLERRPEARLDIIAADIRAEYGKGIEAQFTIGRLLAEAAAMFPPLDREKEPGASRFAKGTAPYTNWFRAQNFPFSQNTAARLRQAVDDEAAVRRFITAQSTTSTTGRDIGVVTAIEYMNRKPKVASPDLPTAPVDPAYDALRTAYNAIALVTEGEDTGNAFMTMHVDDLAACAGYIRALTLMYNEARNAR